MRRALTIGTLLIATFLLYLPTVHYSLVYDDLAQIVENPRLTSWSYVPGYFATHLWAHNPAIPATYYRPVFLIWLRLVYAFFGPPGAIWHLPSIFLHLGVTLSVLMLIRYLTGNWKGALLAAGLFAMHPIQIESVAWVSSASEPLLTVFLVLCVYYYAKRTGTISIFSLLFATLAMFTKETGIIAPALILAYEWTRSNFKDAAAGAAPYLLPLLLFTSFRMNAVSKFHTVVWADMSVGSMVMTWPRVFAAYAVHLLWPVHLSIFYDIPVETAIWPLLVLIVVAAGLIWAVRSCGANVRFGAAWFVITLSPVLALRYLHADNYVHDHYLYLPSVGLALMSAVWFSRIRFTAPVTVTACAVAMALCWQTRSGLRIWRDNTSLFTRAVETVPRNPHAINNLAVAYIQSNRVSEALPLLEQTIVLNRPGYDPVTYYNMSFCYRQMGNYSKAAEYYSIYEQIENQESGHTPLRPSLASPVSSESQ